MATIFNIKDLEARLFKRDAVNPLFEPCAKGHTDQLTRATSKLFNQFNEQIQAKIAEARARAKEPENESSKVGFTITKERLFLTIKSQTVALDIEGHSFIKKANNIWSRHQQQCCGRSHRPPPLSATHAVDRAYDVKDTPPSTPSSPGITVVANGTAAPALSPQLQQAQSELATLEERCVAIQNQLDTTTGKLTDANAHIETLKGELATLKELQKSLPELVDERNDLQAELEKTQATLLQTQAAAPAASNNDKLDELKRTVAQQQSRISSLNAELAQVAQKSTASLSAFRESLFNRFNSGDPNYEAIFNSAKNSNDLQALFDALTTALLRKEKLFAELAEAHAALSKEKDAVAGDLFEALTERNALQEKVDSLTQTNQTSVQATNEARQELARTASEKQKLEFQLRAAEKAAEQAASRIKELEAAVAATPAEAHKLSTHWLEQISSLNSKLGVAKQEKARASKEAAEQRHEAQRLKQQIQELTDVSNGFRAELVKASKNAGYAKEDHAASIATLNGKLKETERTLEQLRLRETELQTRLKKEETANAERLATINQLNERHKAALNGSIENATRVSDSTGRISNLSRELTEAQTARFAAESEAQGLRTQLADLKATRHTDTESIPGLNKRIAQLEQNKLELEEQIRKLNLKIKELEEMLTNARSKTSKEVAELRSSLNAAHRDITNATAASVAAAKTLAELSAQKEALETQLKAKTEPTPPPPAPPIVTTAAAATTAPTPIVPPTPTETTQAASALARVVESINRNNLAGEVRKKIKKEALSDAHADGYIATLNESAGLLLHKVNEISVAGPSKKSSLVLNTQNELRFLDTKSSGVATVTSFDEDIRRKLKKAFFTGSRGINYLDWESKLLAPARTCIRALNTAIQEANRVLSDNSTSGPAKTQAIHTLVQNLKTREFARLILCIEKIDSMLNNIKTDLPAQLNTFRKEATNIALLKTQLRAILDIFSEKPAVSAASSTSSGSGSKGSSGRTSPNSANSSPSSAASAVPRSVASSAASSPRLSALPAPAAAPLRPAHTPMHVRSSSAAVSSAPQPTRLTRRSSIVVKPTTS